ncbi:FIST C domain protein, partial [Vibrio parahaemolyticus V-223/04]
MRLVI